MATVIFVFAMVVGTIVSMIAIFIYAVRIIIDLLKAMFGSREGDL